MYLDVSDVYPKMYPGLVWDTCKIHAKYQDTCILLECNRAFKIHLGYIRIHERYMYPSGYTQDTSQYIRIRILITNPPKLDNKPPLTPMSHVYAAVVPVGNYRYRKDNKHPLVPPPPTPSLT